MKQILVTFSIMITALFTLQAQVSKADFMAKVSSLNTAIDNKSLSGQTSALEWLQNKMDAQISYLKTNIPLLETKAKTDSIAAFNAKTHADALKTKDPNKARVAYIDYEVADKNSKSEFLQAAQMKQNETVDKTYLLGLKTIILQMNGQLAVPAKQNVLNSVLNDFASTLQ